MKDEETQDLQESENWDFERAERRTRVKRPRAVVSVALAREDFEQIAACAEQLGLRASEFIRQAALDRACRQTGTATLSAFSGSPKVVVFTPKPIPTSRISGTLRVSGPIAPGEERASTS